MPRPKIIEEPIPGSYIITRDRATWVILLFVVFAAGFQLRGLF